jgi:uncharacterized protein YqeY
MLFNCVFRVLFRRIFYVAAAVSRFYTAKALLRHDATSDLKDAMSAPNMMRQPTTVPNIPSRMHSSAMRARSATDEAIFIITMRRSRKKSQTMFRSR